MIQRPLLIVAALAFAGPLVSGTAPDQGCQPTSNDSPQWSFSLLRLRNESGDWVQFSSSREWSALERDPTVHVSETLFECAGKKIIRLQGTLRDPFSSAQPEDRLKFHHRTGPNAALTNNGYTAVILKKEGGGVVLTHRPLRTGELFEVRLDKRGTAKGYANGIGITTRTPFDGELPTHMNTLKTGTWLLYGPNVWSNNTIIVENYTASSIYKLKPGDRMGVKKSDTGALHFFVNGVDQGPAASNIPEEVYGVYELYGDATEATIVHPNYS